MLLRRRKSVDDVTSQSLSTSETAKEYKTEPEGKSFLWHVIYKLIHLEFNT